MTPQQFQAQVNAYDKLQTSKYQRALYFCRIEHREILQLIPLLLQINQPKFPFYTPNCPHTIYKFDYQQDRVEIYQKYFTHEFLYDLHSANQIQQYQIEGVYCMGSTSSIVQGIASDLDIWVIVNNNLTIQQQQALHNKFDKITRWAINQKVILNLFLVSTDKFINNQSDNLSHENSGTSQHYLLLDEFYRTSFKLAGKKLLYPCINVPDSQYQETKNQLITQKIVDPLQWIDLGNFSKISKNELLGSIYWHVLKSTKDPYKSIIKIILLETYLYSTNLANELISYQVKQFLNQNIERPWHEFDSYLMVLEKVLNYLQKIADYKRYLLVIIGFMIKINMVHTVTSWHQQKLDQFFKQFAISKTLYQQLTTIHTWAIEKKVAYFNLFDKYIIQSYHKIQDSLLELNFKLPNSWLNDLSLIIYQIYLHNKERIHCKQTGQIYDNLFFTRTTNYIVDRIYLFHSDFSFELVQEKTSIKSFLLSNKEKITKHKYRSAEPNLKNNHFKKHGWYLIIPLDDKEVFSIDTINHSSSILEVIGNAILSNQISYQTKIIHLLSGLDETNVQYIKQQLFAYLNYKQNDQLNQTTKVIILAYSKQHGKKLNFLQVRDINLLSYLEMMVMKIEVMVIRNNHIDDSRLFSSTNFNCLIKYINNLNQSKTIFDVITDNNKKIGYWLERKVRDLISLEDRNYYNNGKQLIELYHVQQPINSVAQLDSAFSNRKNRSIYYQLDYQLITNFQCEILQFYFINNFDGSLQVVFADELNHIILLESIHLNSIQLVKYIFNKFILSAISVEQDQQQSNDLMQLILQEHLDVVIHKQKFSSANYNISIKNELQRIEQSSYPTEIVYLINSVNQTLDKNINIHPYYILPIRFYTYDKLLHNISNLQVDNIITKKY